MAEERAIAHFEAILHDKRDEIKRRIEQRDKYSIQLTIALTAIVAVAFSTTNFTTNFGKVLIAAPLVSIYFTVLILYSYKVQRILAEYLRCKIEPELAHLCGTSPDLEWETYYQRHAVPGIRESFFKWALWVVCVASLIYLWIVESEHYGFKIALIITTVAYIGTAIWITLAFRREEDDERLATKD